MIQVNLAIRQNDMDEATPYYLFISEKPNIYGFLTCRVQNESNHEIYVSSKENFNDLVKDAESFISKLGKLTNVYVIETPEEIKNWIRKLRE